MQKLLLLPLILLFSCQQNKNNTPTKPKSEVLVLGTIHSGHLTDTLYNTNYLTRLIQTIQPDFILAEIPPDRMEEAMAGFKRDDTISEARVKRFPELKAVSEDPNRTADWEAYTAANHLSDSTYETTGKVDDPYFIHSNEYDSIQDISLQMYNKLFNVELGLGGWENINIAHYWNIEKALEKHRYKGKRFLIIYGAGHKGWFLRELRKRDDIDLLEMKPFLDKIAN
jgi:hypothetical protein